MQTHPAPSAKEQYSRLCVLQKTHIRTIGPELHTFAKRNKSFMHSRREREHSFAEMAAVNKERSYEWWCRIQLDEILAKTDASSVIAAGSSLFGTDHRKKKNAYYLCSRCGKPKKGHVCKATTGPSSTNSGHTANTNNTIHMHSTLHTLQREDTSSSGSLSGSESSEYKQDDDEYKDDDDPEYEDDDIPPEDDDYVYHNAFKTHPHATHPHHTLEPHPGVGGNVVGVGVQGQHVNMTPNMNINMSLNGSVRRSGRKRKQPAGFYGLDDEM